MMSPEKILEWANRVQRTVENPDRDFFDLIYDNNPCHPRNGGIGGRPPQVCPCGRPGMSPCWRIGGDAECPYILAPPRWAGSISV